MRHLLIENGTIPTLTGRRITPPPRIRLGSARKIHNDQRKLARWLVEQAREEARVRNDEWNNFTFERMTAERLTPAEWDTLNDYLFGVECVKVRWPR